jgi:hypothetical protein
VTGFQELHLSFDSKDILDEVMETLKKGAAESLQ